jgi:hypothetical protein
LDFGLVTPFDYLVGWNHFGCNANALSRRHFVASVVAGLLWEHVSHTAVFYYGAIFAVAGSVGLLFIPGKHKRLPAQA